MAEASAEPQYPLNDAQSDKLRRQVDVWRKQLIAMNRSQRQVYFKHTRSASLELISPAPDVIAGLLDSGPTRLFSLVPDSPAQPEAPGPAADGRTGWAARRTRTSATATSHYADSAGGGIEVGLKRPAEVDSSLRRLDVVSRQLYADRGLWTLYVGLLMLEWIDPDDDKTVQSPIVLLPVELQRGSRDQPFTVQRNEEDLVLNPSLRLKLEELGVALPEVGADDVALDDVKAGITAAIGGRPGWRVIERAVMTTFSFHKEAMYRDLTENAEAIFENAHVQLLALAPDSAVADELSFDPPDPDSLDSQYPAEELASILDADSSQRACIGSARDGKSFVMDGPPGTGKSQTIANIIVELMSAGKTVLFVSEKAAALDVVRDRLSAVGLRPFLFELHSHAATRKNVVDDLYATLNQQVRTRSKFSDGDRRALTSLRQQLNTYAAAINEVRQPLGRSVFGALGDLAQLPDSRHALPTSEFWANLSDETYREIADHGRTLSLNWRPVSEGDGFLWRDLSTADHSEYTIHSLIAAAKKAAGTAERLVGIVAAVDDDLGYQRPMSRDDIDRRARLVELAERRPQAPDHWLTATDIGPISDRLTDRRSLSGRLTDCRQSLQSTVGDRWTDIDEAGLDGVQRLGTGSWTPDSGCSASALPPLLQFLGQAPERLRFMTADADRLGDLLGLARQKLTVRRAMAVAELALLAQDPAKPQSSWLNPATQAAVQESMRVLGPLTDLVRQHERSMREVFTEDALKLDLSAIRIRFDGPNKGFGRFSAQARADRGDLKAVAVRRKVDRQLLERLGDAVAWQQAHRKLDISEVQYATPLEGTYRRTHTDFGRISHALELAKRALMLAGAETDPAALARQLSADGTPDPSITLLARRLADSLKAWVSDATRHLDGTAITAIEGLSLEETAAWCERQLKALSAPFHAVIAVAEVSRRDLTIAQARAILEARRSFDELTTTLDGSREEDERALGQLYAGVATDWSALEESLEWATQVRAVHGGPLSPSTTERLATLTIASTSLNSVVADWHSDLTALSENFTELRAGELAMELESDLDFASTTLRQMAESGSRDISEWCSHEKERTALTRLNLGSAVHVFRDSSIPAEDVTGAIEAAALRAWLDSVIERDVRLQAYQSSSRDSLVSQYQALDRRIVEEANTLVAERCGARRPKSLSSRAAQVITKEANKKSRHKPIRQLLKEVGSFATEIKPCFMMSPLTVSMFLSGDARFDAVIFDEASQVLPADAINCIYRARQLIVAGDQKQLPPTDFFTRADDAESGDEDIDSFQSVLDLCKSAGGLRSLPLNWHYRSRHEDLITYSNYRFYEGKLKTFPGAAFDSADLGVEHFLVPGEYRRAGSRDNPIEAEKVAERVVHHVNNRPGMSLGVVTFSAAQEDAVRAAIEARSKQSPEIAGLLEETDRLGGFFIKSLENVQGDERDVIIFSVGYGPDENQKFTMNFGPLNREGGWRRLNVAITRARQRVEVISSFTAGPINETNSDGVRHLRGYLDFAQRGRSALAHEAPGSLGDADSVFEEQVAQVIRSWGYVADTQVGAAGYRIDIAVRHPDREGEYVLAVECDGAAYHSARVARDRDRLRQQVLEGLGWTVHRIWGISWWRDRSTQTARLRASIEAAITGTSPVPVATTTQQPVLIEFEDRDPEATPDWAVIYETVSEPLDEYYRDPKSVEAGPALRRYFEKLLRVEAPIHEDVLFERFRRAWGIGRVGSQIRSNVLQVLTKVRVDGVEVRRDPAGFYRIGGRASSVVRVPAGSDSARTVLQIPGDEIDLAVLRTVRDVVVADAELLITGVSRLFGWRRSGADIRDKLNDSISRLVHNGLLLKNGGGELRLGDRGVEAES